MKKFILTSLSLFFLMNNIDHCYGHAVARPSSKTSGNGKTARFITNKMCPFAQKAWIALEASQIPYQIEEVSLYGPGGKPDWFWKLNPKGTVPTLVCPDTTVYTDSEDILNCIGNLATALVPTDSESQSRDKQFRKKLGEFLPIGKSAILGYGGGGGKEERMWEKLKELDELVVGPYVCGSQITTADCAGFPFLWRIETEYGPVDKYGCTNIRSWLDTCQQQPAFSKTIQRSWWWWW